MFFFLFWIGAQVEAHPISGNAITATPCRAESSDPCWVKSPKLSRFAAVASARQQPQTASLSIAWDPKGLLLKIDEIPEHSWVEFAALPAKSRTPLPHAQSVRGTEGIIRLPLSNINAGTELKLQIQLIHDGPNGIHSFPWAPAGTGRHDYNAVLLLVEEQAPKFDFDIVWEAETLHIHAPAAHQITLSKDRKAEPSGSRSPAPWSVSGRDQISTQPPVPGWHHLEARWQNEHGELIDIQRKEIWIEGQTPNTLVAHDIHPKPKWIQGGKGRAFSLQPGTKICAPSEWKPVAELLQEELNRFTGRHLELLYEKPDECEIILETWRPETSTLPSESQIHMNHPEGFGLHINHQQVRVLATTLRGAAYGAMAMVDAIGPDASSPPLMATDSPSIPTRVIHWNLNTRATPNWSVEQAQNFVRRVLTRGRINFLVINPQDSLEYSSHPEIAHGNALKRSELQSLIQTARDLGIEVVPGLNSPGHSDWLTKRHPELIEDVNSRHLCTRHPDARPLLNDLMTELLTVFDEPSWMHIGHDEAQWRTQRWFADERCPRCAGTARSELFAEDMRWHIQWLNQRNVRPILWSDMLLKAWNGGSEGTHLSLSLLSSSERDDLMVFAWSPIGDPIQNLAMKGIETMRVHTGYLDWKRTNLITDKEHIQGEGLGLFTPTPWHAAGPSSGSRPLHYLWPNVLLAGTTAWNTELSNTSITASLNAASNLPAFLPGWSHIPHSKGIPMTVNGQSPPRNWAELKWVDRLTMSSIRYGRTRSVVASHHKPIHIPIGRKVSGISLVQGTIPTHAATTIIRTNQRKRTGSTVARVRFVFEDGTHTDQPIQYGIHTYRPDGDLRSRNLWGTSGVVPMSSSIMGPDSTITDQHLYRLDLPSPHPEQTLSHIEIHCDVDEVLFLVAAAASLE